MKITPSSSTKDFQKFLSTSGERVDFVLAKTASFAAKTLKTALMDRLPKGPEWAALRSLKVGSVPGPSGAAIFGVYSDSAGLPRKKLRKMDPDRHVLYVRPKKGKLVRVPEHIRVLAQFSPWPFGSLPYFPTRREAVIVSRKVSANEIARVVKIREDDKATWEPMLFKAGIHVPKDGKAKFAPKSTAVEDVSFLALRCEFGGSGVSARPIWRPTIRALAKSGVGSMIRSGSVTSALSSAKFQGFRSLPRGEIILSSNSLTKYSGFQSRLKI